MISGPGIEPGTHWWKASPLTTAPTLHPRLLFKFSVKLISGILPRTPHVTLMMDNNAIVKTTVSEHVTSQDPYTLQNSTFTTEEVVFPKQQVYQ